MVALFLAILEMVKIQAVVLTQKDAFGDIGIRRHKLVFLGVMIVAAGFLAAFAVVAAPYIF